MAPTILDIGNCGPDHAAIRRMLEQGFSATVLEGQNVGDAFRHLRSQPVDLVLVNRKLDEDDSDGLEVIRAIKADPVHGSVPVMLISNLEPYQQQAIAAGALRGFGKLALRSPETVQLVRSALSVTR